MDETEPFDPEQPGSGPSADPAPEDATIPPAAPAAPPARAQRFRGALASRAAGWVVAVALVGAVVALSVVLATSPRGLEVRTLSGPFTEVPAPAVLVPGAGPGQVPIHAALPALIPRALCMIQSGPGSFRVILPAGPGKAPGQIIVARPSAVTVKPRAIKRGAVTARPGAITLVCPPR